MFDTPPRLAFSGGIEAFAELAFLDLGVFGGSEGLGDGAQNARATEHFEGLAAAAVGGVYGADDSFRGLAGQLAAADFGVVGADHSVDS